MEANAFARVLSIIRHLNLLLAPDRSVTSVGNESSSQRILTGAEGVADFLEYFGWQQPFHLASNNRLVVLEGDYHMDLGTLTGQEELVERCRFHLRVKIHSLVRYFLGDIATLSLRDFGPMGEIIKILHGV